MKSTGELERENEALRDRLSRLSQASLRINESLDFDTVLQRVLDSACSLTGARYGVITLLDESGQVQDFVYSGLTPEEANRSLLLARKDYDWSDYRQSHSYNSPFGMIGNPVVNLSYAPSVHFPPACVCLAGTIMCTPSNVGNHIDFPQS